MYNQSHETALAVKRAIEGGRPMAKVHGLNTPLSLRRIATKDDMFTFDRATLDSTGAFVIGELERLDPTLNMPLADVTWGRDIDLREDVSMADENSSYTNSTFAQAQGIAGSNKAWAGKKGNVVVGLGLDIQKTLNPLPIWATQLEWTIPELLSAQKLGRSIDQQKYEAMQMKYQMDVDEQVYVGDTALGMTGMLNHSLMTNVGNAINGNWQTATPAQILADINGLISSVWAASGWAIIPNELRIDPTDFGILVGTLISSAGNISILEFLRRNNLASANGKVLNIQPVKWLIGTNNNNPYGITATNSMYAYSRNKRFLRFPLVPLQRTPLEWRDIRQLITYFGRLGNVELVYPETVGRRSNLG